eukprot:SAG11_NODE_17775_length_509_cov_0.990244_1_plen_147_part_10
MSIRRNRNADGPPPASKLPSPGSVQQALDSAFEKLTNAGEERFDLLQKFTAAAYSFGAVLREQGNLVEAEQLYCQCLKSRREHLGEGHPDTISAIEELSAVLKDQGKLRAANELQREVLQLRTTTLGVYHKQTISSLCICAELQAAR